MPFKEGFDPNRNLEGRPKGKTLKEFAREYLASLPDDKKIEYLGTLPKEIVWKMAEGNPAQDTNHGGEVTIKIVKEIAEQNDIDESTISNS